MTVLLTSFFRVGFFSPHKKKELWHISSCVFSSYLTKKNRDTFFPFSLLCYLIAFSLNVMLIIEVFSWYFGLLWTLTFLYRFVKHEEVNTFCPHLNFWDAHRSQKSSFDKVLFDSEHIYLLFFLSIKAACCQELRRHFHSHSTTRKYLFYKC